MTNRSQYDPTNSKLHPETIPTYDPTNGKLHPETIPIVEKTSKAQQQVGVVEEFPVRRETVTTTNSTSHSHPTKSKQELNPGLPILGAIACCIPLAGILGYLLHQPGERVVTRTVTQQVPVLVVPASPASVASPSSVGPAIVGPESVGSETVGPARVGPARVGPARVGPDRVGNE